MSLLGGAQLTLLIGPTVPVPAPPNLIEALDAVQVEHTDEGRSGFQITFRAGRSSADLLDYPFLVGPLLRPCSRVVLTVNFAGFPEVLMDGIITNQQLQPGQQPGTSTLTITGEDVSVMMDLEEKSVEHPAQPEPAIVTKLIASYAQYGLIPKVIPPPSVDVPIPTERTPVQQCTDLEYLQDMAARFGYVFYVTPGPAPKQNTAYWGPPERLGIPQKALTVNMGPDTNVIGDLDFEYDSLALQFVEGQVQDRQTNQTARVQTPVSTRVPLVPEPAWATQACVPKRRFRESGLNIIQALTRAQGQTDASTDRTIKATGGLDALVYEGLLGPRGLVGMRGVGYSYDGLYYVKRVTHSIRMGEYTQGFELQREGLGRHHARIAGMKQSFGKYRGQVTNNMDPQGQGRVQVSCPAVLGEGSLSWAMPCAPYAGPGVGFFAVPPNGANVWVEFEGGDPDYPIWSGCFWGRGEAPAVSPSHFIKIFKTDGLTMKFDDRPGKGGFVLEAGPPVVPTPMTLKMDSSGIEIRNAKAVIKLDPEKVTINNGALEVM